MLFRSLPDAFRLLGLTLSILLVGCGQAGGEVDAVVDSEQNPFGDVPVFVSIEAALEAAPANAEAPHRILIKSGDYREKLIIDKPNLHLIGEGQGDTRVHYDDYAGRNDGQGDTLGTFRTYVIKVDATDVQLHALTIENRFEFVTNDALESDDPNKRPGTQAVALHLGKNNDRFLARSVELMGHQDTLYTESGRAWFDKVVIGGSVDFIFGAGNALFTDSTIVTRTRGRSHGTHGYITAPSTDIGSEFGFTFINCKLTREEGVPDDSTALGRPWHPTTTFEDGRYADPNAIGKAVFINTEMAGHITEAGWDKMGGTARNGEGKTWFHPEDSRFFEYQSTGPGVHEHETRRQLSDEERKRYTLETILGDWQPEEE